MENLKTALQRCEDKKLGIVVMQKQDAQELQKDFEWLLRVYIPSEPENRGMTMGDLHEKCEALRKKHGIETIAL